jgi:integrase
VLRLYPKGNRVFYAVARRSWSPNPVWRHLGSWPEMTVKGARSAAHTAVEKIVHMEPPRPKGALLNDHIESYIAYIKAPNPNTGKPRLANAAKIEKLLRRVVMPALEGVESNSPDIRGRIIDLVIAAKQVRPNPRFGERWQPRTLGGRFAAVFLFNTLAALFKWLFEPPAEVSKEPLLSANPCPGQGKKVHGVSSRDMNRRVLLRKSDELRSYWVGALELPTPASQIFRGALLTGQRRSQLVRLRRDMIKTLGVPPTRAMLFGEPQMKMEELHIAPLTTMMQSMLDELPSFEGSPWFFTYDGERAFESLWRYKAEVEDAMELKGWVLHDMRRTLRSHVASLEFSNVRKSRTW